MVKLLTENSSRTDHFGDQTTSKETEDECWQIAEMRSPFSGSDQDMRDMLLTFSELEYSNLICARDA